MEKKTSQETLKAYRKRIDTALDNDFLRTAMDRFAVAYKEGRKNAFKDMDTDDLIEQVAILKKKAIENRTALLEEFTFQAEKKGIQVHMAADAQEANNIISHIGKAANCQKVIKSKSMTAEETHLNPWLENRGFKVTETDLGEWIVQLRHEGPSHMVMPAIHLSRYQVADLFSQVTDSRQDAKIEGLVKVARSTLRDNFIEADMGITGANFLIAKTATMGLVTNEGNARLATTLPRVHVVLAGIDKILPSLEDALKVARVLPRNATGQQLTSYVTWITGPSQCTSMETDKREMHIVLLDNGRSAIADDPLFSQVLHCVRCGACANVCPVYRMVGGHQMGHIYIGAIGLITTYFFHGRENARNLVQNCTNCGACKAVCAANIDLPRLIKEVHARIQDEEGHPLKSLLLAKVLKNRKLFHGLLRSASLAQVPVTGNTPYLRHLPMVFSNEHNFRALPAIAKVPFRDRWKKLKPRIDKPAMKIILFSGCVQDFVYPEQLEAAVKLFKKGSVDVEFPMGQSCCGLPAMMMGEKEAARDVAIQNVKAMRGFNAQWIVTLCASCASHLTHATRDLTKGFLPDKEIKDFIQRIIPFSDFINRFAPETVLPGGKDLASHAPKAVSTAGKGKVTWHSPCHLCRGMGVRNAPKDLIAASGQTFVQAEEEETCCGFGGSFSANFPAVSREILTRKLDDAENTGAELLVTECPGCVLQLRGGAVNQERNLKVSHLAELLAGTVKTSSD
ncbi:iron-sulfur cluster-binding protein [Desulfocicer vacuolatum DSM 3385]|uniref:Iron-sulfur cluster-binding protein n=1 Tax=Desulfocicer vacuolatum DSM 3385 TaxID=1121400 RepID=A0A1W2CLP6_9BACT|nr:LUD domain-containing protein [Desulfocicer vacuolatum]SMC86139.1 iron-sulfur cluster-binding protein [Desulfocicer vacuolatum DSM 3385]